MPSSRFLLIQLKRIGDFILTAPAVHQLRLARPDAEIVLMVPEVVAGLARHVVGVDRVIPYRAGRVNFEAWGSAIAGEWEAAFDFTGTDRSALISQLSRARHRLGYAKFAGKGLRRLAYTQLSEASVREMHTVDFHGALVAGFLGDAELEADPGPSLRLSGDEMAAAQAKLKQAGVTGPYVILHPGTAREEKFWRDERWAEVAAHVTRRHGLSVVVTGTGEGLEKAHLETMRRWLVTPVVDMTGRCSLLETAALIAGCRLIVGVDSMAMHLAALQERAQIALFGPTNPYHWRARHDQALTLTPGQVHPCKDFQPKAKPEAMDDISTEAVCRAVDALLA